MKIICNAVIMIFILLVAAGDVIAAPTAAALENWAFNHPDAAFELWSWSKDYPDTARKFSVWGESNRERSRSLVSWAITHPGKSIDVFMRDHANWTNLENLIKNHRSAAKGLLAWCGHYPGAAKALMKLPRQTVSGGN